MRGGAQQQVDVSLNTVEQSILQCAVSRVAVEHSNLAVICVLYLSWGSFGRYHIPTEV